MTWKADVDLRLRSWQRLRLQYHFAGDLLTGIISGGTDPAIAGERLPASDFDYHRWTASWLEVLGGHTWGMRVGQMMSHWGLGLLANDGMQRWDSRADGWFELPTTGDTTNRALLWTRPWAGTNSVLRGLVLSVAADRVVRDDIQVGAPTRPPSIFTPHDTEPAIQAVFASRMYLAKKQWFGLYYVNRDQQHDGGGYRATNGRYINVHVLDLAADFDWRAAGSGLRVQAEAVGLYGETSLSPTPEHPVHTIEQTAFAAKVRYDRHRVRFEVDLGYFSGDSNADDQYIRNFKADPNHQAGLVLYRRLLAWQTGRATVTASNPMIIGQPPQDIERFASGGSVTNTMHVFGKAGARVSQNLELYGGVLLAVAPSLPSDPFHTRTVGGGEPRNFLGAPPSSRLLGTEIDAGFCFRWPFGGSGLAFTIRVEYGVLAPGGALQGPNGDELDLIHGGRAVMAFGGAPMTPNASKK